MDDMSTPPDEDDGLEIRSHVGELDRADVRTLLRFHFREMRSISPVDACHVLPLDGLRHPAVTFWSARHLGVLLGVGALKELDSSTGEIKSMRTAPAAVGKGIGRKILRSIITEARTRGYRRLNLETGTSDYFSAAYRLYESEGFAPCGPFGEYRGNEFSRFYGLDLP